MALGVCFYSMGWYDTRVSHELCAFVSDNAALGLSALHQDGSPIEPETRRVLDIRQSVPFQPLCLLR
jgi:hypothetical protein